MILFVPSTGFQSSATFPVALPGGSRTSRISGVEIIVCWYTGPIGLKHFVTGYRIPEERKCSQPFPRKGSFPVFVTRMLPPDAATLPIIVSRRRSRRDDSEYRWRTVWIASVAVVVDEPSVAEAVQRGQVQRHVVAHVDSQRRSGGREAPGR